MVPKTVQQLSELLSSFPVFIENEHTSPYAYLGGSPFWSFTRLREETVHTEIGEVPVALFLERAHSAIDCRGLLVEIYEHSIRGKKFHWAAKDLDAIGCITGGPVILEASTIPSVNTMGTPVILLNRLEQKYGLECTVLRTIDNHQFLLIPKFWADKSICLSLLLLFLRSARSLICCGSNPNPDEDIEQFIFRFIRSYNKQDFRELQKMKDILGMEPLSFLIEYKQAIFEGHDSSVPLSYPHTNPMAAHDAGFFKIVTNAYEGNGIYKYLGKENRSALLALRTLADRLNSSQQVRAMYFAIVPTVNLLNILIKRNQESQDS